MSSIAFPVAALDDHLFWLVSRAAGTLALLLASASVGLGLWQAMRRSPGRGPDLRTAHEALSLATLTAILVHAGSLLGDSYLSPSIADLALPFWTPFGRWWTALGICAGWTLVVLGLTYYARARIEVARWKKLHRFTALAWVAALAHALGQGTDAGQAWFLAAVLGAFAPPLALLALRHIGAPSPQTFPSTPAPRS